MRIYRRNIGGMFLALLFAMQLPAQRDTGILTGLVTDPSSAAVTGAAVSITSKATDSSRRTVTDSAGYYTFASLPVGSYQLTVESPGFGKATGDMHIDPSEKARFDVRLVLGEAATSVQVKAAQPELSYDDSSIGTVISNPVIENTPLLMRNWDDLIRLVPGVQQARYTEQSGATASAAPAIFR